MATIEYRLSSSYLPILATLRENDVNGTIVQSKVLQESGILESFTGVTVGTYVVVGYDRVFGTASSTPQIYTTTTIAPVVKFNNTVYSFLEDSEGNYLVGGSYSGYSATDNLDGLLKIDAPDGLISSGFTAPTGNTGQTNIYAVEELIAGRYLVMGDFGFYDGVTNTDIIDIDSGGTQTGGWTSWTDTTSTASGVYGALLTPDNNYLVWGNFDGLNNNSNKTKVTVVNSADGTFNGSWSDPSSVTGDVRTIITDTGGTNYILGGNMTEYSGVSVNRIVVVSTGGTYNASETANFGTGFNGRVRKIIKTSDNKYMVVGSFSTYRGVGANRIIKLNPDGTKDGSFNYGSGFNAAVYDIIETSDNKFIAVGDFTTYRGNFYNRAIRLNSDGSLDTTFAIGTGFNGIVRKVIETSDNYYLLGGDFTTYKGVSNLRFIKLTSTGGNLW